MADVRLASERRSTLPDCRNHIARSEGTALQQRERFFQVSMLGIWAYSIERFADNDQTALDKPVGEPSDRNVRRRVSIQYAGAAASVKGLRREASED